MRCALLGFEIQTIFQISECAFVAFTIQKFPGKRPCLDVNFTNFDAISLLLSRRIMRFSSMMMVPSVETIMTHSAAFTLLRHGSSKKITRECLAGDYLRRARALAICTNPAVLARPQMISH
jgi:hypothetical protein